jgi:hypothetical protein
LRKIQSEFPPDTDTGWWYFPAEIETGVQGFLGTGDIFIVGDQPSRDEWPYKHEHRRAFYDLLKSANAVDCHLTDFYKRRGVPGQLKDGFRPADFEKHLEVFRREVEILNPSTILAMGRISQRLLLNAGFQVTYVMHFGVIGHASTETERLLKKGEFERSLRNQLRSARKQNLNSSISPHSSP